MPVAIAVVLTVVAAWKSLTLYSGRDSGPPPDPRDLALVHAVLGRVLAGDSAGAVAAGAEPAAVGWATGTARWDSAMVRGWSRATETSDRAERADTITRTWYTTAAMQRCTGAASLIARFIRRGAGRRLVDFHSSCVPASPIIFHLGDTTARQ